MLPRILPSAVASVGAAYVAHSEANTPEGLKLDPQKLSKLDAGHLNKTANRFFAISAFQSMRAASTERTVRKLAQNLLPKKALSPIAAATLFQAKKRHPLTKFKSTSLKMVFYPRPFLQATHTIPIKAHYSKK